ncbi:MAG: hypothetical protein JXB05_33185 [Myxococcaceae bacterium]|nr:hypothetical protein [Myxococcaceae bacterium]
MAAASLFLVLNAGCYHYRVTVPEPTPATEPQRKTVHSLAWGLVNNPQSVSAFTCEPSNALDEVRVSSHFGYTLITTLTLGFWAPLQVEWRCAKQHEEEGIIGLQAPAPQEAPHE